MQGQGKSAGGWARWRQLVLDCLFPPRCVGCRRRGTWLCAQCRTGFPRVGRDSCSYCGRPAALRSGHAVRAGRLTPQAGSRRTSWQGRTVGASSAGSPVCASCRRLKLALSGLFSDYYFEGVLRVAIHQLKYRGSRHLAEPLGELMLETLATAAVPADVLVPVPLHASRLAERGYNQSALLADHVSQATGVPVVDGPLRRARPTEPQMALPAVQRRANVTGAFVVQGRELAGLRVLLVDDVCTTGSTLDACAAALRAAGCAEMWGLTLARTR